MSLDKFISIHVPKTGGTLFHKRVLRTLFPGQVVPDYRQPLGLALFERDVPPKPLRPERQVIHGHFPVDRYGHLGWPYIIWLREPISRLISQYDYTRKALGWCRYPDGWKSASRLCIEEYAFFHRNYYVRYMRGRALEDFVFVGILERFIESIEKFGKLAGVSVARWSRVRYTEEVKKNNEKKHRTELTASQREVLEGLNKDDIAIYRKALEMF